MRFGELAGLGLALLLGLYPFALLLALGAPANGDLPVAVLFGLVPLGFLWPGAYLLSRRLREPADLDVVEADGRAPVLIVHPPVVRGAVSVLPTPSLFRDLALRVLIGGLRSSLCTVGPILRVARPRPPKDHGPVARLPSYEAHLHALSERARGAALVVIVADGSEANARELACVVERIDVRRVVLVSPPDHLHPDFQDRWRRLRERLPGLPALDGRTAAVRFDRDGRSRAILASSPGVLWRRLALARAAEMVRAGERRPEPRPPAVTWLLSALPLVAVALSLVITPVFLREHELGYGSSRGWAVLSVICALALAVLSRRAMRLVPGSELPMVLVAAAPWIVAELVSAIGGAHTLSTLRAGMHGAGQGAGYSAPLLLTTAVVLAGAALVRRSHGRSAAYGVFGFAAVIPFFALTAGLADRTDTGGLIGAALLTGLVVGLVAMASSGDAGRRHAPFPIGAAVSAALALAAWATAVTHGAWRQVAPDADSSAVGGLLEFDQHWGWFILALALVPVAVGAMFRGRWSHVATNSLTLLLLAGLLTSATDAHVARAALTSANDRLRPDRLYLEAAGPRDEFNLIAVQTGVRPGGPVALVLDRGGAYMGGERVASTVQLSGYGAQGTPRMAREIALALRAESGAQLRIAATVDVRPEALLAVCRAASAVGADAVQIVGEGTPERAGSLDLALGVPARAQLVIRPHAVVFATDDGARGWFPESEGSQDLEGIELPIPRRVTVVFDQSASLARVVSTLDAAARAGFTQIFLAAASAAASD